MRCGADDDSEYDSEYDSDCTSYPVFEGTDEILEMTGLEEESRFGGGFFSLVSLPTGAAGRDRRSWGAEIGWTDPSMACASRLHSCVCSRLASAGYWVPQQSSVQHCNFSPCSSLFCVSAFRSWFRCSLRAR